MSDRVGEQVSALLDEELSPQEAATVLNRLSEREDLRLQWGRYHLIGDVMRGEMTQTDGFRMRQQISERLAAEPAIIAAPKRKVRAGSTRRWIQIGAGAGLAASVAVLTIVMSPEVSQLSSPDAPQVATITAPTPSAPVIYVQQPGIRWKNLSEPTVESQLNDYLIDHSEYASPAGIGGVIPYATFVGYDTSQ
jgi:sigma-E factor negative regulatory protein RseA